MDSLLRLNNDEFKKILDVLHKDQIMKLLSDYNEEGLKGLLLKANNFYTGTNCYTCNVDGGGDNSFDYHDQDYVNNKYNYYDDDVDMEQCKTLLNIVNNNDIIDSVKNFECVGEMTYVSQCIRGLVKDVAIEKFKDNNIFCYIPMSIPIYFVEEKIIHNNKIYNKIKVILEDENFKNNYKDKKFKMVDKNLNSYFIIQT